MTQTGTQEQFLGIMHKILDNKTIELSTELSDTAMDSLKYISLVVEVEKTFKMQFDDESLLLHNFNTVGDLYHYVSEKASASKAA